MQAVGLLSRGVISAAGLAAKSNVLKAIAGIAAIAAMTGSALAQQPQIQPIVKPGQAVVTGYSGFVAFPAPEGADPFDYLTINTLGPAARVVDLASPGAQGVLSPAAKPFTVNAAQTGQVFGVVLDNALQPNIFLAATSAYGLSIFRPDAQGLLKRQRQGGPGVQFVPGQFGPQEFGGGPGSIWRVSGQTGQVSLFSTVGGGSPASLGGLAFDPVTRQLFATDRSTGIIYRISQDGQVRGTYDHGIEGRPGAGFAPVPPTPGVAAGIDNPAFSSDNPTTWGFASPARRVFALAVNNNRLYYSIAQGPQVWSAGIRPNGSIPGSDARMEVEVPAFADGIEIASITFDQQGRMYLAERGRTTGDYFLRQLAFGGQSRVLRFIPKAPGEAGPGLWRLQPEQYAVGLAPFYNNADGGVALNYGYTQAGTINPAACDATVWSTGERLLDPGDGSAPPAFSPVEGIQGNGTNMVQPQNMPPLAAWFIDYDDRPGDPGQRGYMGGIDTINCLPPAPPPPPPSLPPPPPPPISCPPGTFFQNGQCLIFPTCPPGTNFLNGQCVYPQCPPGFVLIGGQCVPPPQICPPGTFFSQGQCIPLACPPGLVRLPNGFCACPVNTIFINGQCVPPNQCPPGAINLGGICFCPGGLFPQGNQCLPLSCPVGQVFDIIAGTCVPVFCPPGQTLQNGQCVPIFCPPHQELFNNQCVNKCPPNQVHTMPNGVCAPLLCGFPTVPFNGQCVQPCPPGWQHTMPNGVCKPFVLPPLLPPDLELCLPPNEVVNGNCVPPCPPNTQRAPNGLCLPDDIAPQPLPEPPVPPDLELCLPPNEVVNGDCVPPCPPNTTRVPNGICAPNEVAPLPPPELPPDLDIITPIVCLAPNEMVNGECVPPCPPDTTRLPNGMCAPNEIAPPPPPELLPDLDIIMPILCPAPNEMVNGACVPPCPPDTTRLPNGMCAPDEVAPPPPPPELPPDLDIITPIVCLAPNEMVNGACVPPCPPNTTRLPNGICAPDEIAPPPPPPELLPDLDIIMPILCPAPNEMVNGACVPPCPPNTTRLPNGTCAPDEIAPPPPPPELPPDLNIITPIACLAPNEMVNGACVPPCPPNTTRQPNGNCMPNLIIDTPALQLDPPAPLQPPADLQLQINPNVIQQLELMPAP